MIIAFLKNMNLALSHCYGRIAPVFDVAENMLLVDIEDGREQSRVDVSLRYGEPYSRAAEVASHKAEVLICGAISAPLEYALHSMDIQVIGFLCGSVQEVLDAYVSGSLSTAHTFTMPGCIARPDRFRGSRKRC